VIPGEHLRLDQPQEMNAFLRDRNRKRLKPFFPLLRLLLEAKGKLPSVMGTVNRGIDKNLRGTYAVGDEFYWWAFASTPRPQMSPGHIGRSGGGPDAPSSACLRQSTPVCRLDGQGPRSLGGSHRT
jgi:hypothetical protein